MLGTAGITAVHVKKLGKEWKKIIDYLENLRQTHIYCVFLITLTFPFQATLSMR